MIEKKELSCKLKFEKTLIFNTVKLFNVCNPNIIIILKVKWDRLYLIFKMRMRTYLFIDVAYFTVLLCFYERYDIPFVFCSCTKQKELNLSA